ncbi:MAG: hypothetical protein KIT83_20560, partial [Bryobacterales bacterium]|nr:hypothetical protein [Bryobacterales bacterium]
MRTSTRALVSLLWILILLAQAGFATNPVFFDNFQSDSGSCGTSVDYLTSPQWKVNLSGATNTLQRVREYPCSGTGWYEGITNKSDASGSAIYSGTLIPTGEHEVRARLQLTPDDVHTAFHLYLNASQSARFEGSYNV